MIIIMINNKIKKYLNIVVIKKSKKIILKKKNRIKIQTQIKNRKSQLKNLLEAILNINN